jgi:hypothetical protein
MSNYNHLPVVKSFLGVEGDYQDDTLQALIDEVKEYMIDAGVPSSIIESSKASGCIARGVEDLWVDKGLSNYFYQRVTQMSVKEVKNDDTL